MSETIWDELMRSPLDPDPDEDGNVLGVLVPVGLAAAIGLVLGLTVGGGEDTPNPTLAIETTTTATTALPPADPIMPAGYTEVGGIGLAALASFTRDGDFYIVVNSAARSDQDRSETDEFHIAEWVLAGDGVEITASRAFQTGLTPGVRLVEFPGVGPLPAAGPELRVRRATEMVVRSGCNGCAASSVHSADGEIVLEGFDRPYAITEPIIVGVGRGINLSIDELQITDEWGYATWHAIDETDARLRTTLIIVFEGTDDPGTEQIDPTLLVPPHVLGLAPGQAVLGNPDPFSRDGWIGLDRTGEIITTDNQPDQLVLRWTVEWQHPVGDQISLPLEGITDLRDVG
ncbi:MAG: hypothetical protein U9N84_03635 [Actinomycetota bacterium]|nr:hypothetical protein [Actinomycetota bacterium]